jgi:hypothetical protein
MYEYAHTAHYLLAIARRCGAVRGGWAPAPRYCRYRWHTEQSVKPGPANSKTVQSLPLYRTYAQRSSLDVHVVLAHSLHTDT